MGVTLIEPDVNRTDEPTLEDLRAALRRVDGTDHGVHSPRFISRFTDMTRQAVSYRSGRVLVAGDAAHVHAPIGGQGLNLGVQDSVNLGWKLAQVVRGTSPVSLLDTYHAERYPVGARVLKNTMAQRAVGATDERSGALRDLLAELLTMQEPRKHIAAMISGLDVHYDLGEGHPHARTAHAGPGSHDRRRARARLRAAARRPRRAPQPRQARRLRHLPVGEPSPPGRCHLQRRVGTSRARHGRCALGRADPTGRACRLDGTPRGSRAPPSARRPGSADQPGSPRRARSVLGLLSSPGVSPDVFARLRAIRAGE